MFDRDEILLVSEEHLRRIGSSVIPYNEPISGELVDPGLFVVIRRRTNRSCASSGRLRKKLGAYERKFVCRSSRLRKRDCSSAGTRHSLSTVRHLTQVPFRTIGA